MTGFASLSCAEERQATIVEQGNTSVHYYSSGIAGPDPAPQTGNLNTPQPDRTTKSTARQINSHNSLLWLISAAIRLNTDHDQDGHYSNFTLTLDFDTSAATSAIYSVLYLSLAGGQWVEYAVTGDFTVYGAGPGDTYTLQADLDIGYPSGYYDQLIEVYDAHSHELLTSFGPNDAHSLHRIPFESRQHDHLFSFDSDLTFSFTGTGSFGLPLLLPLVSLFAYRRSGKRKQEATP